MLSPRLAAVANFVPGGAVIADIGTDHARLPIYLVKEAKIKKAIASDVHKGPYEIACRAVREEGLKKNIEVRWGNGLDVLQPGEVNVVVLAGMGGLLINSLLQNNTSVVSSLKSLVLQPQLAEDKVRRYIYTIGWHIEDEALVREKQHVYQVIYAVPGRKEMPDEMALLLGPVLLQKKSSLFLMHVKALITHNEKIAHGLNSSVTSKNEKQYINIKRLIKNLELIGNDKVSGNHGSNGENSAM